MRIIAFKTLRMFYEKHEDCEQQLKAWYKDASSAEWKSPRDIKRNYISASIVGNNRVVFNIKGNYYRLVVEFNYEYGMGYIRFIGTHFEYDRINVNTI